MNISRIVKKEFHAFLPWLFCFRSPCCYMILAHMLRSPTKQLHHTEQFNLCILKSKFRISFICAK